MARALTDRDEALCQVKSHLHQDQQTMKKYADSCRRQVSFAKEYWVYIKPIPHKKVWYLVKSISSCPNGI